MTIKDIPTFKMDNDKDDRYFDTFINMFDEKGKNLGDYWGIGEYYIWPKEIKNNVITFRHGFDKHNFFEDGSERETFDMLTFTNQEFRGLLDSFLKKNDKIIEYYDDYYDDFSPDVAHKKDTNFITYVIKKNVT
jgi:hypothetical protein